MMYGVIRHFTDLQDNNYKYVEGDTYPREGYEPSAERIEELSTDKNKQNTVLIVPIVDEAIEEVKEEMPEISEISEVSAEKPKKRGRKKSDD